VPSKSPKI